MTHKITTTRHQGRAGGVGYYALACTCGETWTAGSDQAVEDITHDHEEEA